METEKIVIRFAGDSGDGIQVLGGFFTHNTAVFGNDISSLPDFPAEIRAPAGTLAGVSSYQLNFSSYEIHTPGDSPDILVAMNPAALSVHVQDLEKGNTIIVNKDSFTTRNLNLAGLKSNPLEDSSLHEFRVVDAPITSLTLKSVEGLGLSKREGERCKNMFSLGIVCWLYSRPIEPMIKKINEKYARRKESLARANTTALQAGYNYAEITDTFQCSTNVPEATLSPGRYRRITGNQATALGLVTASCLAERPLLYGSYPITPASDILHELSKLQNFDIKTFQAEDEIAAIGASIGASYGGALGVTGTSGPGLTLKSESLGLAVMTELPLVVIDVQRGGPSTGLPTKSEQSDLLQSLFGRNGESPLAVVAPSSPSDCFSVVLEACKIAMEYMTPVLFLSDGFLANSSEPWKIPATDTLPNMRVTEGGITEPFLPYARNKDTFSRPWVTPGTKGLAHRIGGLEKEDETGNVSYDGLNHQKMIMLRSEKIKKIADRIPALKVDGEKRGELLVMGWGSTRGAIRSAVEAARSEGVAVSYAHLRHINPLPKNTGQVLKNFKNVLIPELNSGQLAMILRAKFLIDIEGLNKLEAQPFKIREVKEKIFDMLKYK